MTRRVAAPCRRRPSVIAAPGVSQIEMRDLLKPMRGVEARGKLIGERLVVDKAVCAGRANGLFVEAHTRQHRGLRSGRARFAAQVRFRDVKKERQVVLEEIKMDLDNPEYLLHEIFTRGFLARTFARPANLGTPETVRKFNKDALRHRFNHWFRTGPHCGYRRWAMCPMKK